MISFGVTTHNEGAYLQDLLNQLVPYCEETKDEIIIVDDFSDDEFTLGILEGYASSIEIHKHRLNHNFAAHKNYLNSKCNGDYIFQLDADERPHPHLLTYLHDIVDNNTNVDLFLIPRVNIVNGLTEEDMKKWEWQVNENGWVMFPDYQTRLYRNNDEIMWERPVHERIVGTKFHAPLPAEEIWSIYHIKDIKRQREQNNYYESILR